ARTHRDLREGAGRSRRGVLAVRSVAAARSSARLHGVDHRLVVSRAERKHSSRPDGYHAAIVRGPAGPCPLMPPTHSRLSAVSSLCAVAACFLCVWSLLPLTLWWDSSVSPDYVGA